MGLGHSVVIILPFYLVPALLRLSGKSFASVDRQRTMSEIALSGGRLEWHIVKPDFVDARRTIGAQALAGELIIAWLDGPAEASAPLRARPNQVPFGVGYYNNP